MADSNIDNRGGVRFGTPCLSNCNVWIVCEGCGHPDDSTDGCDYSNVFRDDIGKFNLMVDDINFPL